MVSEVGEEQGEAGEKDPSTPKTRGAELARGWGRAWGQKDRQGPAELCACLLCAVFPGLEPPWGRPVELR